MHEHEWLPPLLLWCRHWLTFMMKMRSSTTFLFLLLAQCVGAFLLPLQHSARRTASEDNLLLSMSRAALHSPPGNGKLILPPSVKVKVIDRLGNGTFGGVHVAVDEVSGDQMIAKCARAATNDVRAKTNAAVYLDIEGEINSKLRQLYNTTEDATNNCGRKHVAPYLGEVVLDDIKYLIWQSSGEYTLEDYIEMEEGWMQLAIDLGVTIDDQDIDNERYNDENSNQRELLHNKLGEEILRQLLEGLAYCHSRGVCHRDVKPANILVDPKSKTLRLIDFGSACDMSSWSQKKTGYKGEDKGPRSILYCAPEEFVDPESPYAFDIYSAAITWIRTMLSDDNIYSEHNASEDIEYSYGLADEEHLFQWRIAVRDFGHDLVSWEEWAALHSSLPHGWNSLFGKSKQGIQALRLLSNLMSYRPRNRMSATEALLSSYLNSSCNVEAPELPPAMPWSIMSHIQRWKKDKQVHSWQDEECNIDDLFTKVVALEINAPNVSSLLTETNEGIKVTSSYDAENNSRLCDGDLLLAIGSIDVENASLDHVNDLLQQWPRKKLVPLLLVRDV